MTDATLSAGQRAAGKIKIGMTRRRRRQFVLQGIGLAAIGFAFLMLFILIASLVSSGYKAFTQTHVTLEVFVDPEEISVERLPRGGFNDVFEAALLEIFPDVSGRAELRTMTTILSNGAQFQLRDMVVADPSIIGETVQITVPTSDPFDQLKKGLVDRDTPEAQRRVSDQQIEWFDTLIERGMVSEPLNWGLITNADSRFPELAGLKGALIGSFWALLVCFVISFPLAIGAAIYLEEFAPKNWITDAIEVNINNLAAVPSIIFGLLGLAVFLNFFGLPRSAPLVGGMVLALMTLPTIIIASRAALKSVPPSIREAALGLGASRQQAMLHHVMPLALPGILTGTIIGMAQALGETAPLLMIGMVAFVAEVPDGITSPATALPVQVFMWAGSAEQAYQEKTSAA
ncbi:phosphate ABC transporter permease PstA, partial [Roseitalea porphyridii]|uniref:phosphate ABC transporter permease PstA n=1 Tax=Roseitalea porphyridii TaxID=1852022 RepID=UPI0032ED2C4D